MSAAATGAVSAVTTGVAPGIMPPQVLGGPVWWYVMGVYLLTIVLAAFCLADSLRATRRERFAELPEPAWLYTIAFAVYLVCVVGVWIPVVPRAVAAVPVILTPFALALGVAYLLRVVFPKSGVGSSDDTGEDDASPTSPGADDTGADEPAS